MRVFALTCDRCRAADASPIRAFAEALATAPKVAEAPFALTPDARDVRAVQVDLFSS